jgi:hypothetical protein
MRRYSNLLSLEDLAGQTPTKINGNFQAFLLKQRTGRLGWDGPRLVDKFLKVLPELTDESLLLYASTDTDVWDVNMLILDTPDLREQTKLLIKLNRRIIKIYQKRHMPLPSEKQAMQPIKLFENNP